jgi:hypothetical protein
MATYPDRALLEQPIAEGFGLPEPLPDRVRAALTDVADQARAVGMGLWTLGASRGGVWLSTSRSPHPATEIDLDLRPVPTSGWEDIWEIRIDLAIECECPINHNVHYVRAHEAQASPSAVPAVVQELLNMAEEWTTPTRDAPWWRRHAGLP